jgi:NAD(P)-dependent dehydrogenase (short-subunit alcohol dehydrogenase family)
LARPTAVIVGVGPGLGWALARRFVRAGMRAVIAARERSSLDALVADAGGDGHERLNPEDFEPQACDATNPDDVAALFGRVADNPPDVVVFNAGAFVPAGILDITPDTFERCWRIGCFGGFLVGQAAARLMVRRGRGTILFTGATASLRGGARFANLAVPKFGLRALAQSMARDLGPQNIHVAHVVIDGQIDSERYRHLAGERGPDSLLLPDAIAEAYYQLHLQHRSAWTHEIDLRPWSEKF